MNGKQPIGIILIQLYQHDTKVDSRKYLFIKDKRTLCNFTVLEKLYYNYPIDLYCSEIIH